MILKNKVIILTGAAGLIGTAIAERLSNDGAILILVDKDENGLEIAAEKLLHKKSGFEKFCIDISDSVCVENMFAEISAKFSSLDALINNAGVQAPIGQFQNNNLESWKRNIEINLLGPVYLSFHAIKLIKNKSRGKIINLAGGGSTSSRPNLSAYAVAKTGIVRFTEILAEELINEKIDVNAISPGAINSKMLDEIIEHSTDAGAEYFDALKRKEKGGTDPSIAASLISFLCSDESNGITGKVISAPWDPWLDKTFQEQLKIDKDLATLRRIDNKTFYKKI